MAYRIDTELEQEIRAVFNRGDQEPSKRVNEFKTQFRKHGNITIKHLKRKWNIIALESYKEAKMIPRGLRERIIPADHLHNPRFIEKWTEMAITHGLEIIELIIEEEKIQLADLEQQLQDSITLLDQYQDLEEFRINNDRLKKEVEEFQKEQKAGKYKKYQRDLVDFESGKILDLDRRGGRSRSRGRSKSKNRNNVHFLDPGLDGDTGDGGEEREGGAEGGEVEGGEGDKRDKKEMRYPKQQKIQKANQTQIKGIQTRGKGKQKN